MRLLAFDTSTDRLSIAVAVPGRAPLVHRGEGGAKASAALIPQLLDLLGQAGVPLATLDAIVFGCGPGSFTGLRTACAVAQGLALGAGVPVLPVETLLVLADEARARSGATQVLAVLDARMDEVYAAEYTWGGSGWRRAAPIRLAAPQAVGPQPGWLVAGNAFAAYPGRIAPGAAQLELWPDAQALLRLAPGLLAAGEGRPADEALPLYVRDKVAQTTEERAAARAAAAGATITP
ncbi:MULTISPECIES: tRNA (adenosine(37)-N6)-threonylcarbamoyltransferase complex dimerization subunit type 1 TsaB [Ramlibacter]|uniref:tRNA (Adenosine(37)-N6)-threonylcarbamoyltransferase complex dimerization subunit type 1 TsaB n=1 Tax=Ramlibacter pinisoli TaxID=2682844 RepID=A0A6N8J105_9BURK|nr:MULTISPECIES: tRNA (adenosine(37)-N6)-threonylcarbamoyltransferase complex dimerization subunit type 1 TsaB [Ramlibacter]MBA2962981.1 tRNA (adenosine(37)-N6)-threonylcarbamoyltransferase complex dimerization subunit type 1 TsaB [Ramlibacter sp. CGMCC 1.13660]MVQ32924.1 tRNA (adenosine(37)-N6)-threonylcarbamoyltransferase complex dimerization subunit type 1 TsaB [Ramlibacter pinisoli]